MWTVVWKPSAEQDLAAIWLVGADRDAITAAAYQIDRLLTADPLELGAIRFDTVRIIAIPPVGVEFEVLEPDRLVWVLSVWDTTKSSGP